MSPTPDTQDTNGTSVVMGSPPAPVPLSGAEERSGAGVKGNGVVAVENPYLAGMSKKTRGLKKKMEKIKKTESLRASGKHLNEEQIKLLETKPMLEVALTEHERVRAVIETVAKEQAAQAERAAELAKLAPPPSHGLSIPASEHVPESVPAPLSIPVADHEAVSPEDASTQEQAVQVDVQADRLGSPQPKSPSTESVGIATDRVETDDAEAQTDVSGPPPPPGLDPREVSDAVAAAAAAAAEEQYKIKEQAEARGFAIGRAEALGEGVSKLLKLLHVASRFDAKGERLPSAVDFFSKVLLGKTVPPDEADFDSCLDQSVERAVLYLDPQNSTREVAPGVNFQRLEEIVATLRDQIVTPPTSQGPVFNFFADASPPRHPRDNTPRTEEQGENVRGDTALPAGRSDRTPVPASAPSPPATTGSMPLPLTGPLAPPPRSMLVASPGVPSAANQSHVVGRGEEPSRTAGARHHERQASEMEEGVLPPVVPQTQSTPSPTPPIHSSQSSLPQRERRGAKPRPRQDAVPPYHTAPPPHHYAPQSHHSALSSPPLPHPQHVRSPFQQQTSPPLPAVQTIPIVSSPAGASPPAVVPGGSPNLTYSNGWGYSQQQHQHQHPQYQQHQTTNRPPLHPAPVTLRQDQSPVGPPWGDPSAPVYTSTMPPTQTASSPRAGAARVQEALAGGFSVAPEHVQNSTPSRVQPPPPQTAGVPMQNTTSPTAGQWGNTNGTGQPAAQPSQTSSILDLERGMTSPWQGAPQDTDAVAADGGALNGTIPTVNVDRGLGGAQAASGVPLGFGNSETDAQGSHVQSDQTTESVARALESRVSTTVDPVSNTQENEDSNSVEVANGLPSAAPTERDRAVASKPRGGSGRGRGSGSRARGRGRGEPRSDDRIKLGGGKGEKSVDEQQSDNQQPTVTAEQQAPKEPQNQSGRQDQSSRNGKAPRRPREQARASAPKQEQAPRGQDLQQPRQQQVQPAAHNGQKQNAPANESQRMTPHSKGRGFSNGQSARQTQRQGAVNSATPPKNGWSSANGVSNSESQTVRAAPTPAAPASTSWADDDSPTGSQPAPQRAAGGGGRRNRQSLHQQKNSTFTDTQRSNGLSSQSQPPAQQWQSQGQGPAAVRESGGRSNGQRQGQGGRNTAGGVVGGVSTGMPKPRGQSQVQSRGPNEVQNHQSRGLFGDGSTAGSSRSKVQDGGNGRVSSGNGTGSGPAGATGQRKNKATAPSRRRGGGAGGNNTGPRVQPQRQQQQGAQQGSA